MCEMSRLVTIGEARRVQSKGSAVLIGFLSCFHESHLFLQRSFPGDASFALQE